MNAREIIENKGDKVTTITTGATIDDAVKLLVEHDEGAVMVTDGEGSVVGILTERDVLRACQRKGGSLEGLCVDDLMTRKVVIGLPRDSVACMMAVMIEKHLRHLPIFDDRRLAGMVSMRDLVEARSDQADREIRYLRDYIEGRYPG